eukprot:Opistho-2@34989
MGSYAMEFPMRDGVNCTAEWIKADPTTFDVVAGSIILVGILLSYLPQHITIVVRKSSEGISSLFLLLGTFSAVTSLLNAFVLQYDTLACCSSWGFRRCNIEMLKIYQLSVQAACLYGVFILFLIYFKVKREGRHELVMARILFGVSVSLSVLFSIILACMISTLGGTSRPVHYYGVSLGIFSVGAVLLQYLPQLYKTFRRKDPGSLSIPMMMIQTPGTFIWTYFLASGHDASVTTWLPYLTTACLQGTLLIMCIIFWWRNKRNPPVFYDELNGDDSTGAGGKHRGINDSDSRDGDDDEGDDSDRVDGTDEDALVDYPGRKPTGMENDKVFRYGSI